MKTGAAILAKIENKRKYYQSQYDNAQNDLIGKGTPIVRINAAKARERLIAYDELIKFIEE